MSKAGGRSYSKCAQAFLSNSAGRKDVAGGGGREVRARNRASEVGSDKGIDRSKSKEPSTYLRGLRRPQREHFDRQRGRGKGTIRWNGPKRRKRGEGTQKRADGRAERERKGEGGKTKTETETARKDLKPAMHARDTGKNGGSSRHPLKNMSDNQLLTRADLIYHHPDQQFDSNGSSPVYVHDLLPTLHSHKGERMYDHMILSCFSLFMTWGKSLQKVRNG